MIFIYWEWWISILKLPKFAILACIVWHRLSANQIVRCFKLKKLKNYMRYQVDFLLPLKLQKISYYFGLCRKILLANQFVGFFTFDLFDLLILIPGVHCYIVLVHFVAIKCSVSFFSASKLYFFARFLSRTHVLLLFHGFYLVFKHLLRYCC